MDTFVALPNASNATGFARGALAFDLVLFAFGTLQSLVLAPSQLLLFLMLLSLAMLGAYMLDPLIS